MTAVRAVGFDLGETLLFYRGTPLSWATLYEPALAVVAAACGLVPSGVQVHAAAEILRRHNTRLFPREREVGAGEIFSAVLAAWGVSAAVTQLDTAITAFFGFFQQRLEPYPDTVDTLAALCARGLPLGVLTDVPYGMPAAFARADLRGAGIGEGLLAAVLTSGEVGWRKPHPAGFLALAERLGTVPGGLLYVGNEPKDVAGARAAGARAVFLDHGATGADHGQHATVGSLAEVPALVGWTTR